MKPELKIGLYRHFKGSLYQVTSLARHSETEEWMVVYHPLHSPDNVWVRPLDMFLEMVLAPDSDSEVPRFKPVQDDDDLMA
jgi:hypothetical protein